MEKYYTINEVAMMTGLTTRTLRNYLKMNVLVGEKIGGVWKFAEEDVTDFISNPNVKPSIRSKKNAIVYDFLADSKKKTNEICTVIDLYVDDREAEEISKYFCEEINSLKDAGKIRFSFEKNVSHVRLILSGYEETVVEILNAYYNK